MALLRRALRHTSLRPRPIQPPPPPPSRILLQWSDFTYQGAFNQPATAGGNDNAYNYGGLALRYVDGVLHLLSKSGLGSGAKQYVYEMTVPVLKTGTPYNVASVVTEWGDIYQGQALLWYGGTWTNGEPSAGTITYGLYWDDMDQRLYYGYIDAYSPGSAVADPSIAFSTLDDPSGPSSTAYGPFRFSKPKQAGGGVLGIPAWYADAYLGGQRLAAGFGGYYSIISIGDGGLGPCLFAFAPLTIDDCGPFTPTTNSPTDPFAPTFSTTTLLTFGDSGTSVGLRDNYYENRYSSAMLTSSTAGGQPGNVVSATSTTVTLLVPPRVTANSLSGCRVEVTKSGVTQGKTILAHGANSSQSDYANVSFNLDSAWGTTPDDTYTFAIYNGGARGTVSSVTSSTIFVVNLNNLFSGASGIGLSANWYVGATCYVIGGTGVGTSDSITASSYGGGLTTITLASGLTLDTTSVVCIDGPRFKGTFQSSTSDTAVLDDFTPNTFASNTFFIKCLTGVNAGEEHLISSYDASTQTVTIGIGADSSFNAVGSTWTNDPVNGDAYLIRLIGANGLPNWPGPSRGYQGYDDTYFGAACWIDTGVRHGLFFWPSRGVGELYYQASNIYMPGYRHTLQCFDPMQLPCVTGGAQPDAAWEENVEFPTVTYAADSATYQEYPGTYSGTVPPAQEGVPAMNIGGMAYDATTGLLYVMLDGVVKQGTEYTPQIHVWLVNQS